MSAPHPIPELIRLLKSDGSTILAHGHKEVVIGRAPGRLDVMGGLTDLSGGLCCGLPLEAAAVVAVQRRDDRRLIIKTYNAVGTGGGDGAGQSQVELSLDDFYGSASLLPNATLQNLFTGGRHWAAYIAGVFPMLAKHKKFTRRTHGANIACYSNVPFGVGLGSSAAVACAALSALTAAYHLILDPLEIAVLVQKLEAQVAGSARGILDQAVSMLGRQDELLVLKCQPHMVEGYVKVPSGLMFAGINSGVAPPLGGPAYRTARTSVLMAQAMITRAYLDFGNRKDPTGGYLANVPLEMYERYLRGMLPEKLEGRAFLKAHGSVLDRLTVVDVSATYEPRAAADHHVHEHGRARAFVEKMRGLSAVKENGGGKALAVAAGELMAASHESLGRNMHLGNEATDLLVELVRQRGVEKGFYGARVVGAGGGGTVAVFAEDSEGVHGELQAIVAEYQQRTGNMGQVYTASSAGAAEMAPVVMALTELAGG